MMFLAKYGTAFTIEIPHDKLGTKTFAGAADWTPATGDVKTSKNGGNVVNVGALPVAVGGTGSKLWKYSLSASEMSAKRIAVQVVDSATKAIDDDAFIMFTYGHASAAIPFDLSLAIQLVSLSTQGKLDVNAQCDTAIADANLNDLAQITGVINDAAPTVSSFKGDAALSATDDFYNRMVLVFTGGTLAGLARRIRDYVGVSKTITFEGPFPVAPADTDAFTIIGVDAASDPDITAAVAGKKVIANKATGVTTYRNEDDTADQFKHTTQAGATDDEVEIVRS